jgi:hypothetical protein
LSISEESIFPLARFSRACLNASVTVEPPFCLACNSFILLIMSACSSSKKSILLSAHSCNGTFFISPVTISSSSTVSIIPFFTFSLASAYTCLSSSISFSASLYSFTRPLIATSNF